MGKRRLIGVIISYPQGIYQQRVLDGLFRQCEKYGYEIAAFVSMVQTCHNDRKYLEGELNIFNLMNFDMLDGVIAVPLSLMVNNDPTVINMIIKKLEEECSKPVVAIDFPFGNFPVVSADDRSAFETIADHVLDVHGCRKVYYLSGQEGNPASEARLGGIRDSFEKRGLTLGDDCVFTGDFWYTGGEALADRIADGSVPLPDAVMCANDHMAIGLLDRLTRRGIKVPGQILVTGYDATLEAAVNTPAITTYVPDVSYAAAMAVNTLVSLIDGDTEIIPAESPAGSGLKICSSCGCPENIGYIKERLSDSLYCFHGIFRGNDAEQTIDIGMLLDSYMLENFTASESVVDCFDKIFYSEYLIRPYDTYYMCLKEHWLNTDDVVIKGYPEEMNNVICCIPHEKVTEDNDPRYMSLDSDHMFETRLMLPSLHEEREIPCAFYFVPVHFSNEALGYSVLKCELRQQNKIGEVFHNWLRNVNNALEMIRVQERLTAFSQRDAMTGLLNRRGMESGLKNLKKKIDVNTYWLIFVIDMDGLKYINDNFGHTEGDRGISIIASAARQITRSSELCVRAGGDEFYIIGIGEYTLTDAIVKMQKFKSAVDEENKNELSYEISASIGFCIEPAGSGMDFEDALALADSRMYENKVERKKQRQ